MKTNIGAEHQGNSFDFIRVLAALAVLYSHSFALYGLPEPLATPGQTFGSLAVAVFFALSGFLICQSWQRDPSMTRFAMRRVLRIFPGLLVVVLITALVIGPLATRLPLADYFGSASPWRYIWNAGLALGSPPLAGVFEHSLYPGSVNGSLWTLRYEILMYVVLAISGRLFSSASLKLVCWGVFIGFAVAWCAWTLTQQPPMKLPLVWRLGTEFYADRIAYLGAFFFAGALSNLYLGSFPLRWLVAVALLVFACVLERSWSMPVLWFAVPYAVLVFAYKAPRLFQKINGFDYSFGIYIYAFPVQQVISELGVSNGWTWSTVLAGSALVTVILAALSWHLIEKPALSFKTHIGSFGRQARPAIPAQQ